MGHLDNLLTSSEPGASMHHLHVVGAPAAAVGPLGLPDEGQLHTTVYAIAADGVSDGLGGVDGFVAKTIAAAAVQEAQDGRVVLLAGLSQEAWAVTHMDELGRRLQLQGPA